MAKNIVFCADGTWNGPGESDTDDPTAPWTNVYKLFLNLAGEDDLGSKQLGKEQERSYSGPGGEQVAKYLDGVGNSTNELDRLIGGGFGAGLITRVVRGYTFVSRNYVAGDKIYLIGFSRGAYTARALAGLISARGLLTAAAVDFTDTGAAYRIGAAVWLQWRRAVRQAKGQPLDMFEAAMLDLPGFLFRPPPLNTLTPAPIEAVAVWDTVGALGIPVFTGQHVDVDFFQFADTALSDNINHARHAIAIDEEREDFTPTLWDPDPARIVQALFPGAHADVGGGYPVENNESGLSDGALVWMIDELTKLGVLFNATPKAVPKPDPAGAAHQPWISGVFSLLPKHARTLPDGLGLSRSVIARMNAGLVYPDPRVPKIDYRPSNIAAYLNGLQPAAGIVPV